MKVPKETRLYVRLPKVLREIAITDGVELGMNPSEYIRHLIAQARRERLNKKIGEAGK